MKNMFIIGGSYKCDKMFNTCLKYDVKQKKWSSIANTNEGRESVAGTVFDGKLVISGGYYSRHVCFSYEYLKSVEAYDHHDDK